MMFYILMTTALVTTIWMLFRVRKLKRHDEVLYKFCGLRRQAMRYLRDEDNLNSLSRQEYITLRKLVETINVTIEGYKTHKTVMFNLRYFMRFLREYKRYNKKTETIAKTDNIEIEELRDGIQKALLFGFMTYTPFIKSEVLVRVLVFLLSLLAHTGWKKVNGYISSVNEAFELTHGGAHEGMGHTVAKC